MATVIKSWEENGVEYSFEVSYDGKTAVVAYGEKAGLTKLGAVAKKYGINTAPMWIGKWRCVAISDEELATKHAAFQNGQFAEELTPKKLSEK